MLVPASILSSPDLNVLTNESSSAEKSRSTSMPRNGQRSHGTCRPGIATTPVPGLLCEAVRLFETAILAMRPREVRAA